VKRTLFLVGLLPAAFVFLSCSTGSKSAGGSTAGKGLRVLEAVVVARIYDPPGSPGTTMRGDGNWFLEFEAQDGGATAHYRFPVSRTQYNRYQEGQRVQLIMADNELRDIRPLF
jgi:hypothetical protein